MVKKHHKGLGKLYKRAPKGCACKPGEKILVGKSGVRCMKVRRVGGRKRFVFSNTPAKCNPS